MGKFSLEVVPSPQKKFSLEVVPINLSSRSPNNLADLPKPGSFKLEVIPPPIPEVIAPVESVIQPKGRNRFLSKIGSLLETAKEKVASGVGFAIQHRSTTLALSAAFLRFGVSKAFDLDLVTTDTVIRTGFAAGMMVEKVALPVTEKISSHFGREFNQNPVYKKGRNMFRDAVAIAGGWSLESMPDYVNLNQNFNVEDSAPQSIENSVIEPVQKQQGGTQIPQQNSHPQGRDWGLPMEDVTQPDLKTETPSVPVDESQGAKVDLPISAESLIKSDSDSFLGGLIANGKSFFHSGSIVFPSGSAMLDNSGSILPFEHFLSDPATYSIEPDLSLERAAQGVEVFAQEAASIDPQWSGLVENGENKIYSLMEKLGIEGEIDHAALTRKLQQGIRAYETGNLLDDSPIGRLFHVSNGTGSLISLQTDPSFIEDLVQQGILAR